eukprot:m.205454 g.205454  ORF g.205454 m.205454 type:complete len:484 (-) comp32917_c0_seq1:375-1826(-)
MYLSPKELQPMLHSDTDGFPKSFTSPRLRNPRSKQTPFSTLRTCFSATRNNGVVGTVLKKVWNQLKLWLAISGQIVFWLGAWNLEQYDCVLSPDIKGCAQGPNATYIAHHHRKFPLDDALYRGCITTAVGLFLAIMSNTLYLNAGIEANYLPWCGLQPTSTVHWLVLVPRTLVGLVAGTCLFSGMYVILQQGAPGQAFTFCKHDHDPDWCAPDMVVHFGIFVLGIVFVVATGTFCNVSYLLLPEDSEHATKSNALQRFFRFDDPDADALTFGEHAWCSIRATLSVFGQSLLWFSSTRGLDYTTPVPRDVVYRPLFFGALGLALLYATDSVFENSFMDEEETKDEDGDEDEDDNKSYVETDHTNALPQFQIHQQPEETVFDDAWLALFYINAFVALVGQLIFQYGVWEYLDVFVARTATDGNKQGWLLSYRTTEVNIFMMFIGIVMMKISGCLLANACIGLYPVTPSEESSPEYPAKRSRIYDD